MSTISKQELVDRIAENAQMKQKLSNQAFSMGDIS